MKQIILFEFAQKDLESLQNRLQKMDTVSKRAPNQSEIQTAKDEKASIIELISTIESLNFKNAQLYCSYQHVWKVLEDRFDYNYDQIRDLIKEIVEEHFKLMGLTPGFAKLFFKKWKNISN